MVPTDVAGTTETTGGMGDHSPYYSDTAARASNRDTEGAVGEAVDSTYEVALFPDQAATPDTEATQGGDHTEHEDDWDVQAGNISGTLSTLEPGSPTHNADPDYRAPTEVIAPIGGAGAADTTHTDLPISDTSLVATFGGTGWDDHVDESNQWQTGTKDTVNPTVPLGTTTDNLPGTPGAAPTVAALPRGVRVTVAAVSDPAGAPIRGYRVEGSTGGVDFIPRDSGRSIVVGTLEPSRTYKFRYQAVNDNGSGAFSAWSSAVVPLNPDEAGPGHPTDISADNLINPIYSPDGTTVGIPGAVQNLVAAINSNAGEVDVSFEAPLYGSAPTGYHVEASTGADDDLADDEFDTTLTSVDLTGSTPVTVTVTPTSDLGDGHEAVSAKVAPCGPPATGTAAATLVAGELKIDWTAPGWGATPTGYVVLLSTGETSTVGAVLTKTFTGLSSVSRTAKITPITAEGNGVPKVTNAATALA